MECGMKTVIETLHALIIPTEENKNEGQFLKTNKNKHHY